MSKYKWFLAATFMFLWHSFCVFAFEGVVHPLLTTLSIVAALAMLHIMLTEWRKF